MDYSTFKSLTAEIEGAHAGDGSGYDIQVMLTGGHCLRGPWGYIERGGFDIGGNDRKPCAIFIVQGIGAGVETFALPLSSIVAIGGCS